MTGQSSKAKRAHLIDRIMWMLDEIKDQKITGEMTMYFLQGTLSKRVKVTRTEILK